MRRIEGLSEAQLKDLSPYQLRDMGLTPPRTFLQSLVENTKFLNRQRLLRRWLNLDVVFDPTRDLPEIENASRTNELAAWVKNQFFFGNDRRTILQTVEEMDAYSPVASALDLYAEEAAQPDGRTGRIIWVESSDAKIKDELDRMFANIEADNLVYPIARGIAKYGYQFARPLLDGSNGVVGLKFERPELWTRLNDAFGRVQGYVPGIVEPGRTMQSKEDLKKLQRSRPWSLVTFEVQSSGITDGFGESILLPARSVWRQLKILEDSLVLYRLNRAPDRLIYNIDVSGLAPDEAMRTLDEWRRALRKKFHYNPASGQFRQEYAPWASIDDLFMPVTGNNNTGVDHLAGSANNDQIKDVEHFRRMLFGALRIPAAYMGFDADVNAKATLSSQDIRFARVTRRVRQGVMSGFYDLAYIHLAYRGLSPDKALFRLRMAPVAMLEEIQRAEALQVVLDGVERLLGLMDSMGLWGRDKVAYMTWVFIEYLGLTHDQVKDFLSQQIAGKVAPDGSGGGGGMLGGGGGGGGITPGVDAGTGVDGAPIVPTGPDLPPGIDQATAEAPDAGGQTDVPGGAPDEAPYKGPLNASRTDRRLDLRQIVEAAAQKKLEQPVGDAQPAPSADIAEGLDVDSCEALDALLAQGPMRTTAVAIGEQTCPAKRVDAPGELCGAPLKHVTIYENESVESHRLICTSCAFIARVDS